jgi:hypothetical protein
MAIELASSHGVDEDHYIIKPSKIARIPQYMTLLMSIQSWKWRNIDSTCQFIIFSGNYRLRSSQNALQHERWGKLPGWTRFPDPLWRQPSYGQVGSPSNPELYGNSRTASGDSRRTPELGRVDWHSKHVTPGGHRGYYGMGEQKRLNLC